MYEQTLNEEMRNEFKYLFLRAIIQRVAKQGKIDFKICEKLNLKNAEMLNCVPLPIAQLQRN